jgi:hypothetical protein
MSEIFPYGKLTWPEVAALPRDTPLIVPLGGRYERDHMAARFGHPERIGFLPFGWCGSGLAVPEDLLAAVVKNLLDSLRDDGFTRVYALTPQGIDLGLGAARIAMPHSSQRLAQKPLPAAGDTAKAVLIPIGHTEQHALHLPMSTDNVLIGAIADGAATQGPDLATCLPVFPYGVSTHRASFAGTLNVGGQVFEDFWLGVIDTLVGRGFELFYLMSGHGGNCSFLVNVVKYAGERHRRIFCATAWLQYGRRHGPCG